MNPAFPKVVYPPFPRSKLQANSGDASHREERLPGTLEPAHSSKPSTEIATAIYDLCSTSNRYMCRYV